MVDVPQTDNPNIDVINLDLGTDDDNHGIDSFMQIVAALKAMG